jgi:N-acetylmuramoyl-L-alanine amidase
MKKCIVVVGFVLVASALITCLSSGHITQANLAATDAIDIQIVDKPIRMTDYRVQLAREYARLHYEMDISTIMPQVIVIHWTASDTLDATYSYFYAEEASSDFYQNTGKLNVASQFLIDRDGTIYRLTPEDFLDRHIIGLNWCAIGVENVGGTDGNEDLTPEQLRANGKLVRYLKNKYPTITYLIGHYQQNFMKQTGLWKENIPGYATGKIDPGPVFMEALIKNVQELSLHTFPTE